MGLAGRALCLIRDQNASLVTPAFVQKMLAQDRASRFSTITGSAAGVTDAKLYRIVAINALYGVHIKNNQILSAYIETQLSM